MSDLISRKAILQKLDNLSDEFPSFDSAQRGIGAVRDLVSKEPGFKAVHVLCGKWADENPIEPHPMFRAKVCSLCGYVEGSPKNFCPNCGADMRGSEERE